MNHFLQTALVFLVGFSIGTYLAFLDIFRILPTKSGNRLTESLSHPSFLLDSAYKEWLKKNGIRRQLIPPDELTYNKNLQVELESDFLFKNVSIFCAVISSRSSSSYSVSNTWASKCNQVNYFGTKPVSFLPVRLVNTTATWQFLCLTLKFIWVNHHDTLQWVLVAPDTVMIIPENLRYLLAPLDFRKKYYLGHNAAFMGKIFNSGDASYVLSRGTIKAIVHNFSTQACKKSSRFRKNEDYYLGHFLAELGIKVTDTRDELGRDRFHRFTPLQLIAEGNPEVLTKYSGRSLYPPVQGQRCCSPTSVSFKSSDSDTALFLSYIMHNVKVFGRGRLGVLNFSMASRQMNEVWQKFISTEYPQVKLESVDSETYYNLWVLKETPEKFNERLRKEALALNISLPD